MSIVPPEASHLQVDPRSRCKSEAPPRTSRRGLGLLELLTVVALLIVSLALIVATARHVRASSAQELTRKRLQALVDETSRLIVADGLDPTLPMPPLLDTVTDLDAADGPALNLNVAESAMQQFARDSSDHLAALRQQAIDALANGAAGSPAVPAILLGGGSELRDAWGRPIALLPRQLPAVGIAPDDGPFFVSAGPDGSFLTLSDNLYSYDLPALLPHPGRRQPSTRPSAVDTTNNPPTPPAP